MLVHGLVHTVDAATLLRQVRGQAHHVLLRVAGHGLDLFHLLPQRGDLFVLFRHDTLRRKGGCVLLLPSLARQDLNESRAQGTTNWEVISRRSSAIASWSAEISC